MKKGKKILISFVLISPIILMGCSNQKDMSSKDFKEDTGITMESTNEYLVEGYELLEYTSNIHIIDNNSKHLKLNTNNEDLNLDTANKIKSLLGDDIELVPVDKIKSRGDISYKVPDIYHVKGFEENKDEDVLEQKYIELALQETIIGDFPPSEKIAFISSSKQSPTKALELMLSMEGEINTMLNNLLEEQETKEILNFLKEEISKIESENRIESEVIIDINADMKLIYIYEYDEENNIFYNRFELDSFAPMAKMSEELEPLK